MTDKVELKKISCYDLSDFEKTLPKKERETINSVLKKSDAYNKRTYKGIGELATKEELNSFYSGIGDDLAKKLKDFNAKKEQVTNIQDVIFDCSTYDEKKYTQAIKSITTNNVTDVFKNGCDIGSHTACFYDENRLVNWRSEDKVKEDIKYIRCVLQTYCKDNGIDCSKLDKEEFKYEKTDDSYTCDKDNLLDRYMSLINDTNYLRDKVTQLFTQNNSKKLENAIDIRYNNAIKNKE